MNSRSKMETERSRTRGANYSPEERELLMSLVENYKNVIEDKRLNSSVAKQKHETWKLVTAQFNQQSINTTRTLDSLKKFYKNVKAERKKNLFRNRASPPLLRERKLQTEVIEVSMKEEPVFEMPGTMYGEQYEFGMDHEIDKDSPECELTILPEENIEHAALPELTISRRTYSDTPHPNVWDRRDVDGSREKEITMKIAQKRLDVLELQQKLLEQEMDLRKKSLMLDIELKQAQLESIRFSKKSST